MERAEQIVWTLEYEEDIASDLSAFHRVDDPMTLDGPRYFSLAARLPAYAGILQARVVAEEREREKGDGGSHSGSSVGGDQKRTVSDSSAIAMLTADGGLELATEGISA